MTYTYDIANRLAAVGGVAYIWDANGNLLSDGTSAYTYDHANRLAALTRAGVTLSYAYNGLGDRLQETANGVMTRFTMDLEAGLTQALSDGTNTYLYGVGRIAQFGVNGGEYFLGDALGSVRQLADGDGQITLSHKYEPFGEILGSQGDGRTTFAFTGEQQDAQGGLLYLRARFLSLSTGRFISKDTWLGNYYSPASLNRWNYVEGNPVNFVDPSGMWRWRLAEPMYHMPIEDYYEGMYGFNPGKQLEYPIPGTPFRHPDMFNSLTGDVYEIEPIILTAAGATQVQGYVTDLNAAARTHLLAGNHLLSGNFNWNQTIFHAGLRIDWPGKFRKSPLSLAFPLVDLVADYVGSGVIAYWIEPNALAPVLLGKKLAGIVPNKRLLRPRNWIPSLPSYQPAYAIDIGTACGAVLVVAGGTIMVVTIVEDATVIGVVDDVVTIPGGVLLINYGLKLATFSPAP